MLTNRTDFTWTSKLKWDHNSTHFNFMCAFFCCCQFSIYRRIFAVLFSIFPSKCEMVCENQQFEWRSKKIKWFVVVKILSILLNLEFWLLNRTHLTTRWIYDNNKNVKHDTIRNAINGRAIPFYTSFFSVVSFPFFSKWKSYECIWHGCQSKDQAIEKIISLIPIWRIKKCECVYCVLHMRKKWYELKKKWRRVNASFKSLSPKQSGEDLKNVSLSNAICYCAHVRKFSLLFIRL